jgi:hypothetical protein
MRARMMPIRRHPRTRKHPWASGDKHAAGGKARDRCWRVFSSPPSPLPFSHLQLSGRSPAVVRLLLLMRARRLLLDLLLLLLLLLRHRARAHGLEGEARAGKQRGARGSSCCCPRCGRARRLHAARARQQRHRRDARATARQRHRLHGGRDRRALSLFPSLCVGV